jgi:SAM-dependent MidA family methyltransferase
MVGEQDITAHVDFTALQKAGLEAGLETLFFKEQYRFLMALGFVEKLMELQAQIEDPNQALALRMTLKNLIMPDEGMGSTFKVLIQGKGVGRPELLCNRRISDIPLPI